jgi:hypothetical protein
MAGDGRRSYSIAGVSGMVMFLCSAGLGLAHVSLTGADSTWAYIFMVAVPLSTLVTFWFVAALAPRLFAMGALRFPLTLTLPPVFSLLLMVSATLWTSTDNSLVSPHPAMSVMALWFSPTILLLQIVIQFVALTLVGSLLSRW